MSRLLFKGEPMHNNFATLVRLVKFIFLDFAKASHTEGVPWTTVYDKKMPSVSSLRAHKLTSKSALPPKNLQHGVLHAAPQCSASGFIGEFKGAAYRTICDG